MIEGIEIERFRCFKHSKFGGFKQVNLIGGQNNSGKTSLLEVIFLAISGDPNKLNYFGTERYLNLGELAWGVTDKAYISLLLDYIDKNNVTFQIGGGLTISPSGYAFERVPYTLVDPWVMSTASRMSPSEIAQDFDKATRGGQDQIWLDGFNCIDESIEVIRSFTISDRHRLYIKKKGEKTYNNVSHLGDAMYKISEVLAHISRQTGGILLIDEIENGIHYSHHEAFLEMLFKLCKEFNVQVFATSHSLEMIKAFNKVALEKGFAESSQYMEMFRSARSGEIVANTLAHDTLAYSIANHLSFRGEER